MVFTIKVLKAFPLLGLWPGDIVVVEPGTKNPIVAVRNLPPNYGAIVGLMEEGVGELVNPSASAEALMETAVGLEPPGAPSSPAQKHRRHFLPHLTRVK